MKNSKSQETAATNLTYRELRAKLRLILGPETPFYFVTFIYGLGVSVLTLAIPISVQSLVNTVSSTILIQPLVVLAVLLLSLLIFSGVLKAFQAYIIENFQRKFFARISSEISVKVLNSNTNQIDEENGVELVNRFFDVMTVQKNVTKILTDGISLILKTAVGLLLLAFYHPYFLIFDVLLIALLYLVWSIFGKAALKTAVYESKAKYKVAAWLEEIARVNTFFKTRTRRAAALDKSESLIQNYLDKRLNHFRQLFSQKIFLLAIYALMSALVLGLGGFLVIKGELSLGQLVAAELIITVILSSLSNSAKYLESFYDLYAAVDKLSVFHKLSPETDIECNDTNLALNANLHFNNVQFKTKEYDFHFNYKFEKGKSYVVDSRVYSSKQVFLSLLRRSQEVNSGSILWNDITLDGLSPVEVRDCIHIASNPVIFTGSIRDNLTWGRSDVKDSTVNEALKCSFLDESVSSFEDGLDTLILPSGYPLWSSQLLRLEFARFLINKPGVIVLTEVFDQIETQRMKKMLEDLSKTDSIIIYITNKNSDLFNYEDKLILDEHGLSRYEEE